MEMSSSDCKKRERGEEGGAGVEGGIEVYDEQIMKTPKFCPGSPSKSRDWGVAVTASACGNDDADELTSYVVCTTTTTTVTTSAAHSTQQLSLGGLGEEDDLASFLVPSTAADTGYQVMKRSFVTETALTRDEVMASCGSPPSQGALCPQPEKLSPPQEDLLEGSDTLRCDRDEGIGGFEMEGIQVEGHSVNPLDHSGLVEESGIPMVDAAELLESLESTNANGNVKHQRPPTQIPTPSPAGKCRKSSSLSRPAPSPSKIPAPSKLATNTSKTEHEAGVTSSRLKTECATAPVLVAAQPKADSRRQAAVSTKLSKPKESPRTSLSDEASKEGSSTRSRSVTRTASAHLLSGTASSRARSKSSDRRKSSGVKERSRSVERRSLTIPEGPKLKTANRRPVSAGPSSEELEAQRVARMKEQFEAMKRRNQACLERNKLRAGYVKQSSSKKLTVPHTPPLKMACRLGQKQYAAMGSLVDHDGFSPTHPSKPTSPTSTAPAGPTVVQPFNLRTEVRAPPKPVQHEEPTKVKKPDKRPSGPTVPEAPHFQTDKRAALCQKKLPMSSEERELKELEEIRKAAFKAQAYKGAEHGIGGAIGVYRPGTIQKKPLTTTMPFSFETRPKKQTKAQSTPEMQHQFKARPMPSFEAVKAHAQKPTQQRTRLIAPSAPKLQSEARSHSRPASAESSTEQELKQVKNFKARPLPDYSVLAQVGVGRTRASLSLTEAKSPQLSTRARSHIRAPEKSTDELEAECQFKAQPVPDYSKLARRGVTHVDSRPLTETEEFHLARHDAAKLARLREQEEERRVAEAQFKARPLPRTTLVAEQVERPEPRGLTKCDPVVFGSDQRAFRRKQWEEEVATKAAVEAEREKEAKRKAALTEAAEIKRMREGMNFQAKPVGWGVKHTYANHVEHRELTTPVSPELSTRKRAAHKCLTRPESGA
ncbi:unnamed protein product [Chrysoparadoxa australica]